METLLQKLKEKNFIELAKLSSSVHKGDSYDQYRYVGPVFKYLDLCVHKDIRKYPNVKLHVVLIKADKMHKKEYGQMDRIFVYNPQCRNWFSLYNILPDKKLREVSMVQDDLFKMYEYLTKKQKAKPAKIKQMKKDTIVTKTTKKLVEDLNLFMQKSIFEIIICGDFDIPLEELDDDDDKYVEIRGRKNNDDCYMDWCIGAFNKKEIIKYAKSIPNEEGKGNFSKEYLELGKLILGFFENKNPQKKN